MTRRTLLLTVLAGVRAIPAESEGLADRANQFHQQYATWATAMNRTKPGTLNGKAIEAWDPLPNLWRKTESAWRKWLRGS